MTMGINPPNQHAIFFNQSKSYQVGSKMNILRIFHEDIPGVVFRVPAMIPLNP